MNFDIAVNKCAKMPQDASRPSSPAFLPKTPPTPRRKEPQGGLVGSLQRLNPDFCVAMANSTLPGVEETLRAGHNDVLPIANAIAPDSDGWTLIAPYGRFPYTEGRIQEFRPVDAQEIVANHNSIWQRVKRALVGLPLFRGHPDHVAFANSDHDQTVYGTMSEFQARDTGLWAKVVLHQLGTALVNAGEKFISPNWMTYPDEHDKRIFHPYLVTSGGLTAHPNIKDAVAIANSKPKTNMPNKLIGLFKLPETASEEDIYNAALTAATAAARIPALEQSLQAAVTKSETAMANAVQQTRQATEDAKTFKDAFVAERDARIGMLLDGAVAKGQITPAEMPLWKTAMANQEQFAAKAQELAALPPRVKTEAKTGDLAKREGTPMANAQDRRTAYQAEMAKLQAQGLSHSAAHSEFERTHPNFWAK